MIPDSSSCYVISGRPSSYVRGQHLVDGGVYLSGQAVSQSPSSYLCFGQLPDVYRDSNAPGVGIPVCSEFSAVLPEEQNFVAQYDRSLRALWTRFTYDGSVAPTGATTVGTGQTTALAAGGTSLEIADAAALLGTPSPGVAKPFTLTCGTATGTVKVDTHGGEKGVGVDVHLIPHDIGDVKPFEVSLKLCDVRVLFVFKERQACRR